MNNYIVWRVLDEYVPHLSWEYRTTSYRFRNARYGSTEFPETWESCLYSIRRRLGPVLASEFLSVHIDDDAKKQVKSQF